MRVEDNIDDRLWEYLDGNGNEEARSVIAKLIASDRLWKKRYDELKEVQELLSNHLELDAPSMRFTQNVMEDINHYKIAKAAKMFINKKIIWGIAAFFIVVIAGLLAYCFSQVSWPAINNSNNKFLPAVNWNVFFNNTYLHIFIMVNIILGLLLLDQFIRARKAH